MSQSDSSIRSHLPLKPVEFLVLAVLRHGALHGYGLVQAMDQRTDGQVKVRPGDLYRVLYRMSRRGLVAAAETGSASSEPQDERRAYYEITDFGRRVVEAEARMLAGIVADVMKPTNTPTLEVS